MYEQQGHSPKYIYIYIYIYMVLLDFGQEGKILNILLHSGYLWMFGEEGQVLDAHRWCLCTFGQEGQMLNVRIWMVFVFIRARSNAILIGNIGASFVPLTFN